MSKPRKELFQVGFHEVNGYFRNTNLYSALYCPTDAHNVKKRRVIKTY